MNLKEKIEAIPIDHFYTSGHTRVDIEAYGQEDTYIINVWIEALRDAYYGPHCVEHIRENDEFQTDKRWLKDYFLDNLNQIEI